MKTKIFCDIADLDIIRKFNKKKNCQRVYNRSSNEKSRCKIINLIVKKYLKVCKKNLFLLRFLLMMIEMVQQGTKISKWGRNVYVKVPVVNSKNKFSGKSYKRIKQ